MGQFIQFLVFRQWLMDEKDLTSWIKIRRKIPIHMRQSYFWINFFNVVGTDFCGLPRNIFDVHLAFASLPLADEFGLHDYVECVLIEFPYRLFNLKMALPFVIPGRPLLNITTCLERKACCRRHKCASTVLRSAVSHMMMDRRWNQWIEKEGKGKQTASNL